MRHARTLALALLAAAVLLAPTPAEAARVYTTRMNIDTNPTGADVYLVTPEGEQAIGRTPLKKVKIPRGLQTLRFRLQGYQDLVETLEIGRYTQTIVYNLVKEIVPATLELVGDAAFHGASVTVDGAPQGRLPASVQVQPGRHQVVIEKEGYQRWEKWIDASEGQKVTFEVVLRPEDRPTGSLLVTSAPSGAQVRVNGKPVGVTPTVVDGLVAGQQLVELVLEGYVAWSKTVAVGEGERAVVDAKLAPLADQPGELRVIVDVDGAAVYVDGENVGAAPVTRKDVAPGLHLVEARSPGLETASQQVEVKPGEATIVRLSLKDATARARGSVRIISNVPGAMASVDGSAPKAVPLVVDDLTAGTHFVTVTAPGYASWTKTVTVEPGRTAEVLAEMAQAGALEVTAEGGAAEVFLDGKLLGKTPFKGSIATGTYQLTVKRADGRLEERSIAIGTDTPVRIAAKFKEKKRTVRHRAMPWSGQPIDRGYGTVDLQLGWPYVVGARISGGLGHDVDLGAVWRSALDTVNEFEARAKWMPARSRAFTFALEGSVGFGLGGNSRNSFLLRAMTLSSIMISERAAVTARIGLGFYTDRTGPSDTVRHEKRDNGVQVFTGLGIEFRMSKYWNGFILLDGEPFTKGRRILEEGIFGEAKAINVSTALGVSLLF